MRNRKDHRRAQFIENLRHAYAEGGRVEDITGLSDAGVLPDTVSSEAPPAVDPDTEWLLRKLRTASRREQVREAGLDPDMMGRPSIEQFVREAPIELGMSVLPAARLFPKTTGLGAGLATFFGSTSEAGEADDAVKQLQQQLRDAGYYSGPIDGIMGGGTRTAKQQFDADAARREQADLERQRVEAARTAAQAQAEEARREREEAKLAAQQRAAGEQRMREMEENVPAWRRILRDYGPMAGYAAGALAGIGTRKGMTGSFSRGSKAAASKMDELVSGQGDLPARMGGVNRFWQEGGAKELPFNPAPTSRFGMQSNPKAPSATTLHQPPPRISEFARARDAGVLAGAGTEAMVGQKMAERARADLAEAYDAVERDPSEANIQRLQAAMDRVAVWDFTGNLGRGMGLLYAAMAPKMRYQSTRPNVAAGEAERTRLDLEINPQRGRRPSGPSGSPPSSPSSGTQPHWALQPRDGGRFAGPPKYPKGDPRRKP